VNNSETIFITGMARTPMGGFRGELKTMRAPQLGAVAVGAALERSGVAGADVDEVLLGCVLPAGLGQAPARQAAVAAGVPMSVGCTTVNKMCGSGMKAAMLAHDQIKAGAGAVMAAGGMESMSNAPYLINKARGGLRLGHRQLSDHMFLDGLEDAHYKGKLMGSFAEDCAAHYEFGREAQDEFAVASLSRARRAIEGGFFDEEVAPVAVDGGGAPVTITADEQPHKANADNIPRLKPAFREGGTVTPANSSSISDGAAALVLMSAGEAEKRGTTPLARVAGHASHAHDPAWFTTAPIFAVQKLLDKLGWDKDGVDLFEINEAFAVVTMAAMHDLDLPHDKVNIHGGACALGHPVGASGARIIATLLAAMRRHQLKRGVAALCIGGGEAVAMGFETVS